VIASLPEGSEAHIGTTDVDLVIGPAIDAEPPDTYHSLATDLERAGVTSGESYTGFSIGAYRRSVRLRDRDPGYT